MNLINGASRVFIMRMNAICFDMHIYTDFTNSFYVDYYQEYLLLLSLRLKSRWLFQKYLSVNGRGGFPSLLALYDIAFVLQ